MEIVKQLILNLALLLIIFYAFQIWQNNREFKKASLFKMFLFFLFSIIISQLLSITVNSAVRYDLRGIPLIIGGLYLGYRYNLILFICSMFIRALFGITTGFWLAFIVYGIQTVLTVILYKTFNSSRVKKKICISVGISIISSIEFMVMISIIRHSLSYTEWISYIGISAIGTGIIISTIENWRRNKYLQKKIIQSEKLEAISQMSAAISHEVRNPLTSVQGFLQLLKNPSFDEKKKQEFINIALSEIKRADKIIQDYLTFAKPSIHNIEKMNFQKEITQAINIIQPLASMGSIPVNTSFNNDIYIYGDPHKFRQSIVNLLKNSIEAMPNGGILNVISYKQNNLACLEIIDSGIGMTKEQVLKLGEPYYSTKGAKGTGLGLMVSFGIIRAMNGNVQVESQIGQGTKFFITFPN